MIAARQMVLAIAGFVIAITLISKVGAEEVDPSTGLIIATGWEQVRAHCGACHSYKLVTAQRGDRRYWLDTIRWMQRTQNLWPLPEEVEEGVLRYLEAHYNETEWGRRPPLSPALRPTTTQDSEVSP